MSATFRCLSCGADKPHDVAQLDEGGFLICTACYLISPPPADVDSAIEAAEQRLRREEAHSRQMESVCDACGARTCNGGCDHGCR